MGGINAVSTLAALVLPGMYILTRPGRRRRALAGWWVPAVLLATAWWAGPLLYQGRYGFNFLPYIEQATTTTATMSAATVLRGSGNWVAYLNFGQPWLTAGSILTRTGWAIAAGTVTEAELDRVAELALRRDASTVTIGHGRSAAATAAASAFARRWEDQGRIVLDVVTWPEEAASWLRQATRFAAANPDS